MRTRHAISNLKSTSASRLWLAGIAMLATLILPSWVPAWIPGWMPAWIPRAGLAAEAASPGEEEGKSSPQAAIYTCSMHPQVMQDKPGNCPICGMKLVPLRQEPAQAEATSRAGAAPAERKIAYWWDPMMQPPYISDRPGKSPMGMDLVPVYADQVRGGPAVMIDPVVTQNMGLRVAQVTKGPISTSVRTVGSLRTAEPNQYEVTARVGGYVERLYADTEGKLVRQGSPLFDLYSPELLVAGEEALAAKRALEGLPPATDPAVRAEAHELLADARRKMELWNVPDETIEAMLEAGKASPVITFRSPATGFIAEKDIVAGSAVEPGQRLLRIVDQSTLWLDARIYENQVALIKVGQKATASVTGYPERLFSGAVVFIDAEIDPESRTLAARLAFPNTDLVLKPGMYATVEIAVEISDQAIQIPREAVIDTGMRQIVFVASGEGRFEPRVVRTGIETSDGMIQILQGLAPGETVVTSGQFLLDTESRTREAIQKMTGAGLLGHQPQEVGSPPPGEEPPPGGTAGLTPADADAILAVYLPMAEALAADTQLEHAGLETLVRTAEELARKAGHGPLEPIASGILDASRSMPHGAIGDQRKQFRMLSEHVVNLVEHVKPSAAIGRQLYIMHCPMYPGDWLQTDKQVANPFYGRSMLECGTITSTIDLQDGE